MANPRITYTPTGEGSTIDVELGSLYGEHGLQLFAGGLESDLETQISHGGIAQSLVHDFWREYELRLDAISRSSNPELWHRIAGLVGHLRRGGQFAFAMDSANTVNTLLDGAITKGDTSITCDSSTGLSAGDLVEVEDADDALLVDVWRVATVPTGTTFTISYGSVYSFSDNSPIRHLEYFPTAVAAPNGVKFREREAGKGADLWDLELTFRTVRG